MKILLAEDDLHTREALVDILRGEGVCVNAFPHGQAGLESFLQEGADLVILDVIMPQLSGDEVCTMPSCQAESRAVSWERASPLAP